MERKYIVLNENQEIVFKKNNFKIIDLVKKYQPIIYHKKILKGYPPSSMLYEVMEEKDAIIINYYVVWRDEIHPVRVIHFFYKIFRILYYGSSLDIEFISVKIDKEKGDIIKVKMESDSHNNPHTFFSDHIKLKVEKENNSYNLKINDKFVKKIDLPKENNRAKIEAITWNHVFGIYEIGEEYLEFKETPLVYLSDNLYKKYRMSLRSKPEDILQ